MKVHKNMWWQWGGKKKKSFTNYIMTLYLSNVHTQTLPSTPITQKCQILSCDTLVTNEQYKKTIVNDSKQT